MDGTEDYLIRDDIPREVNTPVDEDDKEDATTPDDDIDELEIFSKDD